MLSEIACIIIISIGLPRYNIDILQFYSEIRTNCYIWTFCIFIKKLKYTISFSLWIFKNIYHWTMPARIFDVLMALELSFAPSSGIPVWLVFEPHTFSVI